MFLKKVKLSDLGRRAVLSSAKTLSLESMNMTTIIYKQFIELVGEIYTAEVHHVRSRVVILIDDDGNEIILPKDRQIPSDFFRKGDSVRGVIESVELKGAKPSIVMSRTAPSFWKNYLNKRFQKYLMV